MEVEIISAFNNGKIQLVLRLHKTVQYLLANKLFQYVEYEIYTYCFYTDLQV